MKQNQRQNRTHMNKNDSKRNRKGWLMVAVVVGFLTTAFAAAALQGKISLDSPVSFPVDI